MVLPKKDLALNTNNLSLDATIIPWDTEVFSFPVASIERIHVADPVEAIRDYAKFEIWRDAHLCELVSCRLPHDRLRESMLLEHFGFRFIEMVLHPVLEGLGKISISEQGLSVVSAEESDLDDILDIAESAFTNERFHADPRLDTSCSHQRYGRWVRSTLGHPRQQLLKIVDGDVLVAFFVVEVESNGSAYWHLTAVSPQHQGKGYGRRTWLAMIKYHSEAGHSSVRTTISTRNIRVLNLYSRLNFQFLPPEMTFHWVQN